MRSKGDVPLRFTDTLKNEHRVIEQVLCCLEKMADRYEAGERLELVPANEALSFFRTFGDSYHHAKEETVLFPIMENKGFSQENGPTGVMLHEHEEGRRHVGAMQDALNHAPEDMVLAGKTFVEHARAFLRLLREHIQKEDHCLFPMAEQALSTEEQERVQTSFDEIENLGEETHGQCLDLANRLANRFDVPIVIACD